MNFVLENSATISSIIAGISIHFLIRKFQYGYLLLSILLATCLYLAFPASLEDVKIIPTILVIICTFMGFILGYILVIFAKWKWPRSHWANLSSPGDWRVAVVLGSATLVTLVTLIMWAYVEKNSTSAFASTFWPSWLANVGFFFLVGIVGTLISLTRPEKGDFESRARIMVGGKTGLATDYLIGQFRRLGYYSEITIFTHIIEEYDNSRGVYKIRVIQENTIRNFLDDLHGNDKISLSVEPDDIFPMPQSFGELTSVKVDKQPQISLPIGFDDSGKLTFEQPISIPQGTAKEVSIENWFWYLKDHDHPSVPVRYAEKIRCVFINRATQLPISAKITLKGITRNEHLMYDRPVEIEGDDFQPLEAALVFRLEAPHMPGTAGDVEREPDRSECTPPQAELPTPSR